MLILGPVGVGKTHLATALGHIAIRRRLTVAFHRAARLDNTLEAEIRRITSVDLLIVDLCRYRDYADQGRGRVDVAGLEGVGLSA